MIERLRYKIGLRLIRPLLEHERQTAKECLQACPSRSLYWMGRLTAADRLERGGVSVPTWEDILENVQSARRTQACDDAAAGQPHRRSRRTRSERRALPGGARRT